MSKVNKKVLLIEDDPDQIYLYKTKFKLEGFNIITAKDGQKGIKKAIEEQPDFILLDIVMVDMDGMETLKKIKANPKTKNIPVAMLTNLIKKDLIKKSKKMGAIGFWPKTDMLPQAIVDEVKKNLNLK